MKTKIKKEVTPGMLATVTKLVAAAQADLKRTLNPAQIADLLADNTKWRSDTITEVVNTWLAAEANPEKKLVGTVDLTPTWEEMVQTLLMLLMNGNSEGRETAQVEIMRMAGLADRYVASTKKPKPRVQFIAIGSNGSWGRGFDIKQAKAALMLAAGERIMPKRWNVFQCTINTYVNDMGGLNRPESDPEALLVDTNIAGEIVVPVESLED
jgi:hypothetical protein